MSVSPAVLRRLMRELSDLRKNPPEGIRVQTSEEDMLDLTGIIEGPEGTPYAGGYFRVKFKFTEEFPAAPPKCWFTTKMFHPNVSSAGEICVNTLKKDWKPTYGISHILVTVKCLLIYPNPESALDEEAGKLLLENYDSYCARAKMFTSIHAKPRVRPAEFDTPSGDGSGSQEARAASSSTLPSSSSAGPLPTASVTNSLPLPSASPSKAASPPPQPSLLKSPNPEKPISSASNDGKRHVSPSPLSIADANLVGGVGNAKNVMGSEAGRGAVGAGAAGLAGTEKKAVKRAATTASSGAEKRKKALKRL